MKFLLTLVPLLISSFLASVVDPTGESMEIQSTDSLSYSALPINIHSGRSNNGGKLYYYVGMRIKSVFVRGPRRDTVEEALTDRMNFMEYREAGLSVEEIREILKNERSAKIRESWSTDSTTGGGSALPVGVYKERSGKFRATVNILNKNIRGHTRDKAADAITDLTNLTALKNSGLSEEVIRARLGELWVNSFFRPRGRTPSATGYVKTIRKKDGCIKYSAGLTIESRKIYASQRDTMEQAQRDRLKIVEYKNRGKSAIEVHKFVKEDLGKAVDNDQEEIYDETNGLDLRVPSRKFADTD